MFAAAFLSALLQLENPKTVNGEELGRAEDFRTVGPARVCLETASIDLQSGETAFLQYAGIHSATLRILVPAGFVDLHHGDHWAEPKKRKRHVANHKNWRVVRIGHARKPEYLFYAVTDYSDGEQALVLRVDGSALDGSRRDLSFLNRIALYRNRPPSCAQRYAYGWDMLFDEEPVKQGSKE